MERDRDQAFIKGRKYCQGRFKGQELQGESSNSVTQGKKALLTVSSELIIINTPEKFRGGQLIYSLSEWKNITSDNWIHQTVSGYKLEMSCKPWQPFIPCSMKFSQTDQELIDAEIKVFKTKGITEEVTGYDDDEFYSNIFTRLKKDGTVRVILNLKRFNDCMEKIHFKMETLKAAITNIPEGDYFGSIDLKDAYFSVSKADCDRKYLRFV